MMMNVKTVKQRCLKACTLVAVGLVVLSGYTAEPQKGSVFHERRSLQTDFDLINGFAQRKDGQPEIFSRAGGNLTGNPVTDAEGFAIDSIRFWVGTGFVPPPEAIIVSSLGEDYEVSLPSDGSKISGKGLVNSAILPFGRGRICLIADAGPFYALLRGIKSEKRGMNHPDATQNARFLLNILHWLDAS